MEILRAIKAATAKHDPSYRLKKRGLLNAHDMKRLIPAYEQLMEDVKIDFNRIKMVDSILTSAEKVYAMNDIINTTDVVKHLKG